MRAGYEPRIAKSFTLDISNFNVIFEEAQREHEGNTSAALNKILVRFQKLDNLSALDFFKTASSVEALYAWRTILNNLIMEKEASQRKLDVQKLRDEWRIISPRLEQKFGGLSQMMEWLGKQRLSTPQDRPDLTELEFLQARICEAKKQLED